MCFRARLACEKIGSADTSFFSVPLRIRIAISNGEKYGHFSLNATKAELVTGSVLERVVAISFELIWLRSLI